MKKLQLNKINYSELNKRQQENYNFHKISCKLSDYGYSTTKLNDDYNWADFLAVNINWDILKIQLKWRLFFAKKYEKKDIYIGFPIENNWYLMPHDKCWKDLNKECVNWENTDSWKNKGEYHCWKPSKEIIKSIEKYKI